MADRLRYAARVGVKDRKLARLASRGLTTADRATAARAADVWLTTRGPDTADESAHRR